MPITQCQVNHVRSANNWATEKKKETDEGKKSKKGRETRKKEATKEKEKSPVTKIDDLKSSQPCRCERSETRFNQIKDYFGTSETR